LTYLASDHIHIKSKKCTP